MKNKQIFLSQIVADTNMLKIINTRSIGICITSSSSLFSITMNTFIQDSTGAQSQYRDSVPDSRLGRKAMVTLHTTDLYPAVLHS